MDIRSFFGQKPSNDNNKKTNSNKRKESGRTEVDASAFFASSSGKKVKANPDDQTKPIPVASTKTPAPKQERTENTPTNDGNKKRPFDHDFVNTSVAIAKDTKSLPSTPVDDHDIKTTTPSSFKKNNRANTKKPLLKPTLELSSYAHAAPQCWQGLTFCFTGILEDLDRVAAQDYVKTLGGRVTTAVSSKTSYLVIGNTLEDGRSYTEGSKYAKALACGTCLVMGTKQLYGLARLYSEQLATPGQDKTHQEPTTTTPRTATTLTASAKPPANPYAKPSVANNPYAKKSKTPASNPYAKTLASANQSDPIPATTDPNALWADKYAPQSTRDILGNADAVHKLSSWLATWERTFSQNPKHWTGKAALLSGPPGIGKTTTATLVAKEQGRLVTELNASDSRSKKTLQTTLGDATKSRVLAFGNTTTTKRCLIMDEVDGMGAGDRSGISELIQLIKSSRIPIICICNDRQSQKLKSLLPYCLDLRYKRPIKSVIARRAVRIGQAEGMAIEVNAAEAIAESCGNDIRQVLNCLQMWHSSKEGGNSVTYKDLKEREASINKDEILRINLFDATKLLVEGRQGLAGADAFRARQHLWKRSDAFFVDYSLMGLNVHQNYPKVMAREYAETVRKGDDAKMNAFVDRLHQATRSISDYAMGEQAVRGGDQNWSLLPFVAMMTVKTGYHAGGENGGFLGGYPEFSTWLGKNSSRGKTNRLLGELGYHMNYKVSTDKADLRLYYLPLVCERILKLLTDSNNDGKSNIVEAIDLMDDYGLDRDDVFDNLDEFALDPKAKKFGDLDSKIKAAFTREYNQRAHKSQALVAEQGAGKISRKSIGSKMSSKDPSDLDAVDDDGAEESDDDEEEMTEQQLKELFSKRKRKSTGGKKTKESGGKKS